MSTFSFRVTDNELHFMKTYAKMNNIKLSELIRKTILEKIEDEYDLKIFAEYEEEKTSGKLQTRPIEQLWKEIGI